MICNKKLLAVAVATALGGGAASVSAATTTLTFIDNTGGTFGAGSEFGVFTPGFSLNNGPKNVINGGETWTFNAANNLTGTGGSSSTAGANANVGSGVGPLSQAPITLGVGGYPLCEAVGSCGIIQNGVDFLMAGDFTMSAPTTSNGLGAIFGDTVLTLDEGAGTISVFFPIVYTNWANGNYAIGTDYDPLNNFAPDNPIVPGDQSTPSTLLDPAQAPGVTLTGTLTPSGNNDGAGTFSLIGSYTMTRDEVTVGGFAGQIVFWDLNGTYGEPTVVPVPAAVWLFGSGLVGLVGVARRKKISA